MLIVLIVSVSSAFAQQNQKLADGSWVFYGEEFYKALSSGKSLEKKDLNQILNFAHTPSSGMYDIIAPECIKGRSCYRPESVNYEKVRKIMFGELDLLKDSQGSYVVDVYCEKKFYFSDADSAARKNSKVNIEHTWPQSKFSGNYLKDVQKSDMHHLYLADSNANAVRGNNPFGFLFEGSTSGEGCDESSSGSLEEIEIYTPPAAHRGNIARSLFYFSTRYDQSIPNDEETVLRQWHKEDPVDQAEINRHEKISKYQKVRNPFIDHPEAVKSVRDF